jgi:hypothetical protein
VSWGVRPLAYRPASLVRLARRLLWIDCTAGLLAGAALLVLARWLSGWYALPAPVLVSMGVANLGYAAYSFSLARRARRPRPLLLALIAANAAWAGVCGVAVVWFAGTASVLGMAHLLLEGAFVGGLAALEWTHRDQLLTAS